MFSYRTKILTNWIIIYMKHFCFQMLGCSDEHLVRNECLLNVTVMKTFLPIIAPLRSQAATISKVRRPCKLRWLVLVSGMNECAVFVVGVIQIR